MTRIPTLSIIAAPILGLLLGACAHPPVIPNTRIPDNPENREVIAFLEQYRTAVERRDMGRLTAMASESYFDDMGTVIGTDDIDYDDLKTGLVRLREEVLAARYDVSYRRITRRGNRLWVDFLYTGWFKVLSAADGEPAWKRRLRPHRLALAREEGRYRILSGI
jgi:hypothetical protein